MEKETIINPRNIRITLTIGSILALFGFIWACFKYISDIGYQIKENQIRIEQLDKDKASVIDLQRQEIRLEQYYGDLKEIKSDMKEIRADLKEIIQTLK